MKHTSLWVSLVIALVMATFMGCSRQGEKTQIEREAKSNESKKAGKDDSIISHLWPFGPDGWICRYLYPSAYTETERNFWNAVGCGCEREREEATE